VAPSCCLQVLRHGPGEFVASPTLMAVQRRRDRIPHPHSDRLDSRESASRHEKHANHLHARSRLWSATKSLFDPEVDNDTIDPSCRGPTSATYCAVNLSSEASSPLDPERDGGRDEGHLHPMGFLGGRRVEGQGERRCEHVEPFKWQYRAFLG